MLNVLMFIFGSFWRWAGFTIILAIVCVTIVDIIKVIVVSIVTSISVEAAHLLTDDENEETKDSTKESSEEED